jgi:hypothetical protein
MRTYTFTKTKLLLGSLAVLVGISTVPSWAVAIDKGGSAMYRVESDTNQGASPLILTNGNAGMLKDLLDATDDLDKNHKSRQSVLFFFGLPANIHFVGSELEKLSKQYGGNLRVVTIDPAYLSEAGDLQKAWVQGAPSYPTAVFIGNGVCLNQRGAITSASLEQLAAEGMTWDYSRNHKAGN